MERIVRKHWACWSAWEKKRREASELLTVDDAIMAIQRGKMNHHPATLFIIFSQFQNGAIRLEIYQNQSQYNGQHFGQADRTHPCKEGGCDLLFFSLSLSKCIYLLMANKIFRREEAIFVYKNHRLFSSCRVRHVATTRRNLRIVFWRNICQKRPRRAAVIVWAESRSVRNCWRGLFARGIAATDRPLINTNPSETAVAIRDEKKNSLFLSCFSPPSTEKQMGRHRRRRWTSPALVLRAPWPADRSVGVYRTGEKKGYRTERRKKG